MSTDGKSDGKPGGQSTSSIQTAKSALASLLAEKKTAQPPSQTELAKQLKKEIVELRAQGVSFGDISAHLKQAGISISKNALGAAIKKRTRRPNGSTLASSASTTGTTPV